MILQDILDIHLHRYHLAKSTSEPRKLDKHKINDPLSPLSLKPFVPPVYHSFYDNLQADTSEDDETLVLKDDTLVNSEDESVSEPSPSQQQVEELGFPASVQHDTRAIASSRKRKRQKRGVNTLLPVLSGK